MAITNTDFQNIQLAISAYSDEAYTNAKKLNGTGIVAADQRIDTSGENFYGQFRWYKPLNATVNVPSLSSATNGTYTGIETDYANFIKTMRTFGAEQVNLQEVVSKEDGLAKIARDFAEVRAQDEHDALLSVLKGVSHYEVALGDAGDAGNGGIVDFDTDADAAATGMFVDVNAAGLHGAAATGAGDARKLFDSTAIAAARVSVCSARLVLLSKTMSRTTCIWLLRLKLWLRCVLLTWLTKTVFVTVTLSSRPSLTASSV